MHLLWLNKHCFLSVLDLLVWEEQETSGDLSQLVDSLKKTLQEKTATVTNSIFVYVSVDNLDGFLDILDGLKDYPLSVQKGWAGF